MPLTSALLTSLQNNVVRPVLWHYDDDTIGQEWKDEVGNIIEFHFYLSHTFKSFPTPHAFLSSNVKLNVLLIWDIVFVCKFKTLNATFKESSCFPCFHSDRSQFSSHFSLSSAIICLTLAIEVAWFSRDCIIILIFFSRLCNRSFVMFWCFLVALALFPITLFLSKIFWVNETKLFTESSPFPLSPS